MVDVVFLLAGAGCMAGMFLVGYLIGNEAGVRKYRARQRRERLRK